MAAERCTGRGSGRCALLVSITRWDLGRRGATHHLLQGTPHQPHCWDCTVAQTLPSPFPSEKHNSPQNLTRKTLVSARVCAEPETTAWQVANSQTSPLKSTSLRLPTALPAAHCFRVYFGERHLQARSCSSRTGSTSGPAQALGETAAPTPLPSPHHSSSSSTETWHGISAADLPAFPADELRKGALRAAPGGRRPFQVLPRALRPKMGQARHRAPSLPVQGTRRSQLMKHTVSSRKTSLPAEKEHQGTADKQ